MITSPEKENFSVPVSSQFLLETDPVTSEVNTSVVIDSNNLRADIETTPTNSMTNKTMDEISHRVEEIFAKLQRNLEHNTRVFQEKSQGLLSKIDQAEEKIRKVLAQLESTATGGNNGTTGKEEANAVPAAAESIALSDETTKLESDETSENL